MSTLLKRPWYPDGRQLIRKVDRWVSRRSPHTEVGEESDWLGWDGWVRTDSGPRAARDTIHGG